MFKNKVHTIERNKLRQKLSKFFYGLSKFIRLVCGLDRQQRDRLDLGVYRQALSC